MFSFFQQDHSLAKPQFFQRDFQHTRPSKLFPPFTWQDCRIFVLFSERSQLGKASVFFNEIFNFSETNDGWIFSFQQDFLRLFCSSLGIFSTLLCLDAISFLLVPFFCKLFVGHLSGLCYCLPEERSATAFEYYTGRGIFPSFLIFVENKGALAWILPSLARGCKAR